MLWSKIIGAGGAGGLVEGWNVSTAVLVQSFSVAAQETAPRSVTFKPDGTKMYVSGNAFFHQYNLGTAWDVSTALFSTERGKLGAEVHPSGLFFKPDGLKMYFTGSNSDAVSECNISTAWDVSTASYVRGFSVSAQETAPTGLFFKPDGTKMYVTGTTGDDINEYNLSTAWDVSSTTVSAVFSVSGQENQPFALFFKPDGMAMYILGNGSDTIHEYTLSTAWEVLTASYVRGFGVSAQDSVPYGLFFKPDGTKMYVIGQVSDRVHEYDLTA